MQIRFVFVIALTVVFFISSRMRVVAVLKSLNIITLKRRPTRIGSDNGTEFVELLENDAYVIDGRRLPDLIC